MIEGPTTRMARNGAVCEISCRVARRAARRASEGSRHRGGIGSDGGAALGRPFIRSGCGFESCRLHHAVPANRDSPGWCAKCRSIAAFLNRAPVSRPGRKQERALFVPSVSAPPISVSFGVFATGHLCKLSGAGGAGAIGTAVCSGPR
jgi:hypothetical protein